jgi:hypothetical protein
MSLLGNKPLTQEQQQENNTPVQWSIVAAVMGTLLIYAYLFTHVADWVNLPRPQVLLEQWGFESENIFDDDRNVDSELFISSVSNYNNDDERLILFAVVAVAFLSCYFLPLRLKKGSLFIWFLVGMGVLYGVRTTTCLLLAHWLVYLVLHVPRPSLKIPFGFLAGVFACIAFAEAEDSWIKNTAILAGWGMGLCVLFNLVLWPMMRFKAFAKGLRTLVVQSALITVGVGAVWEGIQGESWALPLGILLFFWHWERLMMYHVDYKSGRMPKEISPIAYLSVFLTPASLPNWKWGVTLGQGYTYLENNFYCVDKNRLAMEGLKIWGIALIYLVFNDVIRYGLISLFEYFEIEVYSARITTMVSHYVAGGEVTTSSVLATTVLDQIRWMMLWGGSVHFKTGIWRICGYRMDPYFNKPWMSTNLVTFWTRFTFHYREFLVRCFYYPVFFKFFKNNIILRVSFATFAAVTVGNLVWGHITEGMFYRGVEYDNFGEVLKTWPYFILLTLGITVTELYLLWRRPTRKVWTLDRYWLTDFFAMYCTVQFYCIIHVFAKPSYGATLTDCAKLFLIGFGIDVN